MPPACLAKPLKINGETWPTTSLAIAPAFCPCKILSMALLPAERTPAAKVPPGLSSSKV